MNMFRKLGVSAALSTDADTIMNADRVVLPGVGSFTRGAQRLQETGTIAPLTEFVRSKGRPLLGICLGMQLLSRRSEEGAGEGLGFIAADTVRLGVPEGTRLKIPHMGWNTVKASRAHPLFGGMSEDAKFYFVHSYHVVCDSPEVALGHTEYGSDFVSILASENITGVQFHPEKSHRFGMRLLENFAHSS
jgi:glutamine amidotransferase